MRKYGLTILGIFILSLSIQAQISYGGRPLPLNFTRSDGSFVFEEMPSFDVEEELRIDSLNGNELKGSYRFAYKFMACFDRGNSGYSFTLADGTKVWRLGISSPGALSLNVLFTEFEIPEGARLFLYNPDQSHILGSFTHQNNSDLRIFPVSPVEGDRLIIEYQEPANADFAGRLVVGEVNHAYRSFREREPGGDQSGYHCMDPVACFPEDPLITEELGRSVVLLIIDGISACSGVMVNNTDRDGTPYVLTASHCINKDFTINDPDRYEVIAGSIVCFFNYSSPLCSAAIRGTEEMSMSSATLKAINENVDMALLELLEIPPAYYQPYYAGWNISEKPSAPYFGIHHPRASVKRVNWLDDGLGYMTFKIDPFPFFENVHWLVKEWTAGSTDGGSSGSPLFDGSGRVIGALSGGYSTCLIPKEDYYFALDKAWAPSDEHGDEETSGRQLSHWLDPSSKAATCNGLDPYASESPCIRLSNVQASGKADNITIDTIPESNVIPLFGNNAYEIYNYAEAYHTVGDALLHGVYIVTPAVGRNYANLEVEIVVYEGENRPETLLHSETFQPEYVDYSREEKAFIEQIKSLNRAQESFMSFSVPVTVHGNFYVGYRIVSAPDNTYFAAYNLPEEFTGKNTAWLLSDHKWIEATAHPAIPKKTSLFIDPVIQSIKKVGNTPVRPGAQAKISISPDRKTAHILLPEGKDRATFSLISMTGQAIQTNRIYSGQTSVSLKAGAPGVYLIKLTLQDQELVQKILF